MNRDEFEKWAVARGICIERYNSPKVGPYNSSDACLAWESWQACSRLYAKLTAEPTPGALTLPGDFFSKGKL